MFTTTILATTMFSTTRRQLLGAAFGLALAAGTVLPGSAVAQAARPGDERGCLWCDRGVPAGWGLVRGVGKCHP